MSDRSMNPWKALLEILEKCLCNTTASANLVKLFRQLSLEKCRYNLFIAVPELLPNPFPQGAFSSFPASRYKASSIWDIQHFHADPSYRYDLFDCSLVRFPSTSAVLADVALDWGKLKMDLADFEY
jgi:hypothetical protein